MARKIVEVELKAVGADKASQDINEVTDSLQSLEVQNSRTAKETESLTDSVTTNGGAMGVLNELTGGLATRFKDSYEALALTNKSLKGLKGALLATGIGAAVLAVGYLVTNFREVEIALGFINVEQEKFNEAMENAEVAAANASRGLETLRDVVLDTTADETARTEALTKLTETVKGLNGVTLDQEGALQKIVDMTQPYIEATQKRAKADAFASLVAEEEAEILKARLKFDKLAENFKSDRFTRGIGLEMEEKRVDVFKEQNEFLGMLNEKYAELNTEALAAEGTTRGLNKAFEDQKNITADLVDTRTLAQKAFEKDITENQFFIPGVGYVSKETFQVLMDKRKEAVENDLAIDQIQAEIKTRMENEAADNEIKKIELEKKRKLAELDLLEATESEKANIIAHYNQRVADATKKQDQLAAKEKEERLQQTIGSLVSIVGASSKFGKGIAAASAIRDTFAGANKAFAQGGIFGFVQAAAIIASGLKNVKTIMGTNDPAPPAIARGASVSSEPSVSIPSTPTESLPPQFSTVGASGVNQLASLFGNQPPVQAFVVSGDVTTAQELDRNIITSASIG